jgi:RHS repeat-associated protein
MKNGIGKYNKHYYTGNHLSSTQLVTDGTGVAIQQVEYAPFGEVVNEYNIDWSSGQVPDFKFNGKELDEESGMYYFEARYQSPPVFISRDPLFEKYPTLSPYAYCANNPVNCIDPDGKKIFFWHSDGGGDMYRGHRNKRTQRLFETFARTEIGKTFLQDFANAKQTIGDLMSFTKNGKYAKHILNIIEYSSLTGDYGYTTYSVDGDKQNGFTVTFNVYVNTAYMEANNATAEDYVLTVGHEFLLHVEAIAEKLINAADNKDNSTLTKIIDNDSKNNKSGDKDHKNYINKKGDKSFNTFVEQLKSVMDKTKVTDAKKEHDKKYEHLRE